SSAGATVSVHFAPPTCVPAPPTVIVSPSQSQWVPPGTTVPFTLSVTNHDSAACTASTFTLQAAVPAGWTANFPTSALTLRLGSSASTTPQITAPATAADGFYTSTMSAMNSTDTVYAASTAATVVL